MNIVTVQYFGTGYASNKSYAYLTDIGGLKAGDHVVVDSPNSGYTVVLVTSVEETADAINKATKWIVSKVDVEGYQQRLERQKERETLMAKLKKMQAEMLERDQFATLAATNPEAAELVKRLKSLA